MTTIAWTVLIVGVVAAAVVLAIAAVRRRAASASTDSDAETTFDRRTPEPPGTLRGRVYLRGDGVLLVDCELGASVALMGYESLLREAGRLTRTEAVALSEIHRQRQEATRGQGSRSGPQQRAVEYFHAAAAEGASDIHIRIFAEHAEIRFRVSGDLSPARYELTRADAEAMTSTIYLTMCSDADAHASPEHGGQDAQITDPGYLPDGVHGIRVVYGPHVEGKWMVCRILYEDTLEVGGTLGERLTALGYRDDHIAIIDRLRHAPQGIIVVAGPTGSGKSTTLKHILEAQHHDHPEQHICSVEDPAEYRIQGIVQVSVTGAREEEQRRRLFHGFLRTALRGDPDTIWIGEMRDRFSAEQGIRAAETGHVVFSTLHARSSIRIVSRLAQELRSAEMPDPVRWLADTGVLAGLVFQRLVKILCDHCKRAVADDPGALPAGTRDRIERLGLTEAAYTHGRGCSSCNGTGVASREVVAEVCEPDEALMALLADDGFAAAHRHWREAGGRTIHEHAADKIAAGRLCPLVAERMVGDLDPDSMAVSDAASAPVEAPSRGAVTGPGAAPVGAGRGRHSEPPPSDVPGGGDRGPARDAAHVNRGADQP